MKRLLILGLLILIGCGGGGGGGSDDNDEPQFTAPQIIDGELYLQNQRISPFNNVVQPTPTNPPIISTRLIFDVLDPDLDAAVLIYELRRNSDNILIEADELELPVQDMAQQTYFTETELWEIAEDFEYGIYTFIGYVVDEQGLESQDWVVEFCIRVDQFDTQCNEFEAESRDEALERAKVED